MWLRDPHDPVIAVAMGSEVLFQPSVRKGNRIRLSKRRGGMSSFSKSRKEITGLSGVQAKVGVSSKSAYS